MRVMTIAPFLTALALLAACSRKREPALAPEPSRAAVASSLPGTDTVRTPIPAGRPIKEYLGSYQRGFEMSWFSPCGASLDDGLWWVTLTDEALAQRDSLLAKLVAVPTGALAVRWRGSIGPRMRAGHTGRGTRYMLVSEVIDIRPLPSQGACGTRT